MANHNKKNGDVFGEKARLHAESVRESVESAFSKHESYAGAARELNLLKVPTFKGGDWWPSTVQRTMQLWD